MEFKEILDRALTLLVESKIGLLGTMGEDGGPRSRWMTVATVDRLPGAVYAVTARSFAKVRQIAANPKVEWIFQSRSLDRIATLRGEARIVDEPAFSAEVVNAIGPNLSVFWRMNHDPKELVVVETEVGWASIFYPITQVRHEAEAAYAR